MVTASVAMYISREISVYTNYISWQCSICEESMQMLKVIDKLVRMSVE